MSSISSTEASRVLKLVRERLETVLLAGTSSPGFGHLQASQCSLGHVELTGVRLDGEEDTKPDKGATALTTVELDVDETMCNLSGNAHGGFLAWLIDHCSSLSLIALAGHGRWVTSGVSTNLNVNYIAAAPAGTPIRVVTRILQQTKTIGLLESRVEHRETGRLLAFGTHVKQDTSTSVPFKWPKPSKL